MSHGLGICFTSLEKVSEILSPIFGWYLFDYQRVQLSWWYMNHIRWKHWSYNSVGDSWGPLAWLTIDMGDYWSMIISFFYPDGKISLQSDSSPRLEAPGAASVWHVSAGDVGSDSLWGLNKNRYNCCNYGEECEKISIYIYIFQWGSGWSNNNCWRVEQ